MSKRNNDNKKPLTRTAARRKQEFINWLIWIVSTLVIALCLRLFVFEIIKVDGDSMNNTLYTHQSVFVEKLSQLSGSIERKQIIIVRYPNSDMAYVKRVVGLPGDTIEVKDGSLYVNGERQDEPYINTDYINSEYPPATVPKNSYFVMGDNRNNSMDSRNPNVGPIPLDSIIGHAMFVIFPLDQISSLATS